MNSITPEVPYFEMNTKNKQALQPFIAPDTKYFLTRNEFDKAVGKDFIRHANQMLSKDQKFLVGLSHGKSPAGAYQYIFDHYNEIKNPENILYTFVNSKLNTQRDLAGITDATNFIRKLYKAGYISRSQILGSTIQRQSLEDYTKNFRCSRGSRCL